MSLWDSISDGADTAWNAARFQLAISRDAVSSLLGDDSYRHTTAFAESIGLPTDDVPVNAKLAVDETPGLGDAVQLWNKAKEELEDALPPGPWWAWALGGVFVLGAGIVVTLRVLR